MPSEFDNGNARHDVPSSFLRTHEPVEAVAPSGRGFYVGLTFHPLSIDDDALCDAGGVPVGFQWAYEHEWQADRERLFYGQHVEILTPAWAARRLSANSGRCCVWDGANFRLWATRNYERAAGRLVDFAIRFEEETRHVDGTGE
jgi:hypothetical protein